MKKTILILTLIFLLALPVAAFPPTPPSSSTGATINDSAGNGDATVTYSADKIYDLLALKQSNLSLIAGTMTNTYLCTYTTAGTLLSCNTNPASFQAADADLTTYAGITPSANVQSFLGAANYAAMKTLMGYYTSGDSPTFAGVTISKVSGSAGDMGLYEANSTDVHAAGFRGPASITGDGAYRIVFPNARAGAAGQVLSVTNAGESGTGTAADPYIQAGSWITAATASSSDTFTNKTLDVDGTGNVVKSWGYLILTHPHVCGSAAPMQTTSTANTFGQCKFADDAEADNFAEYYLVVPADIDLDVDLVATFKFKLGGADTADHDYLITFDSVADSAAYAGSLGDGINLAYTADGSGADADVETATGTLTGWRSAMTAGQLMVIRVTRDGDDGTNDASTVDSYSGPLVIKYKITQ